MCRREKSLLTLLEIPKHQVPDLVRLNIEEEWSGSRFSDWMFRYEMYEGWPDE